VAAAWVGGSVFAVLCVIGVVVALGPSLRSALLVETQTGADTASPTLVESPAEEDAFFTARDQVTVVVPRDMTVGELVELYSLGRNSRTEIARTLKREVTDETLLRRGQQLTLRLTHVVEPRR
jgi:hypothetical protein